MGAMTDIRKLFGRGKEVEPYKRRNYLNALTRERLDDILLFSEGEGLMRLLPDLKNKRVLFFNDQRHKYILNKIRLQEPTFLMNGLYRDNSGPESIANAFTILLDFDHLPFKNNHFDLIICPLVLDTPRVSATFIEKLSKKLKNGGRLILSLRHPQLEHLLFNQNPSETIGTDSLVSRYFQMLKDCALYPDNMQEGIVDPTLKSFFMTENNSERYLEFRNVPLTLFFRAVRYQKTKETA
jgi:SAM-dependent methyltransferase